MLDTLQGLLEVVNNIVKKKAKPRPLIERKDSKARYGGEFMGPKAPIFWEQDLMVALLLYEAMVGMVSGSHNSKKL